MDPAAVGAISRRAVADDCAGGKSQIAPTSNQRDPAAIGIVSRRAITTDRAVGESDIGTRARKDPAAKSSISRRAVATDRAAGECHSSPTRRDSTALGIISRRAVATDRAVCKSHGSKRTEPATIGIIPGRAVATDRTAVKNHIARRRVDTAAMGSIRHGPAASHRQTIKLQRLAWRGEIDYARVIRQQCVPRSSHIGDVQRIGYIITVRVTGDRHTNARRTIDCKTFSNQQFACRQTDQAA